MYIGVWRKGECVGIFLFICNFRLYRNHLLESTISDFNQIYSKVLIYIETNGIQSPIFYNFLNIADLFFEYLKSYDKLQKWAWIIFEEVIRHYRKKYFEKIWIKKNCQNFEFLKIVKIIDRYETSSWFFIYDTFDLSWKILKFLG